MPHFIPLKFSELRSIIIGLFYQERERWLLWAPVLQLFGILFYFYLKHEPSFTFSASFILASVIISLLKFEQKYIVFYLAVLPLLFFGMGITIVKAKAARIEDLSQLVINKETKYWRLTLKVKEIYERDRFKSLILEMKDGSKIRLTARTKVPESLRSGDIISTSATLFPLPAPTSQYGYDFSLISYFRGIKAVGFTTSSVRIIAHSNTDRFAQLRHKISKNFQTLMKDPNKSYIVSGILVGKKDGISTETMNDIRDAGLSHLLAISGLHLSFITALFFSGIRRLLLYSTVLSLKYNIKKITAALAIVFSSLYLLLIGSPISAQRAFIMVLAVLINVLLDENHNSARSLAISAIIILLISPQAAVEPGFHMSFMATLALVLPLTTRRTSLEKTKSATRFRFIGYIWGVFHTSLLASLATLPYTIYHFNYISLIGVVSNIVAVPIVTFCLIPLGAAAAMLSMVGLDYLLKWPLIFFTDALIWVAHQSANFKYATVNISSFSSMAAFLTTIGLLWLIIWQERWRYFGIILIILGILLPRSTPDLLFNNKTLAVKYQNNLYFYPQVSRGYLGQSWQKATNSNQRLSYKIFPNDANYSLFCTKPYGCAYNTPQFIAIFSTNQNFVQEHCSKDKANKPCIDILSSYSSGGITAIANGWMKDGKLSITASNRPWHQHLHQKSLKS